jgi:hypothetical protein
MWTRSHKEGYVTTKVGVIQLLGQKHQESPAPRNQETDKGQTNRLS